jgi:hypothetical protein
MKYKLMSARFNGTKCNYCSTEIHKGDGIVVDKSQPRKKRSFCSGKCADANQSATLASIASIEPKLAPKPMTPKMTSWKGVFA